MAHLYIDETVVSVMPGDTLTVTGEEAHHAVTVSRLREGETTVVGNGKGLTCEGTVTHVGARAFSILVTGVSEAPVPDTKVWIVQALAKGDRAERAIELCTEFGAWGFMPWQAHRSISRWNAQKAVKGQEKWHKIVREASKQSLRPYIPEVAEVATTAHLCALAQIPENRVLVLHPRGALPLSGIPASDLTGTVYLCVGPEGGLADEELDQLQAAGAQTVVLGSEVLRTSSAGAAGLSVVNLRLGRW